MTVETYLVYADPPMIGSDHFASVAAKVAGPLHMSQAQVLSLIEHPTSREYVVLASGVSADDENKLAALNVTGIAWQPSFARAYPNGDATANVVGLTNTDPTTGVIGGYAGIEQEYDKLLTGTAGSEQVMTGPGTQGAAIPLAGMRGHARQGRRLDRADDHSRTAVRRAAGLPAGGQQDEGGRTARSSSSSRRPARSSPWPSGPTRRTAATSPYTKVFEPGSTAKVITASAALEHGGKTPMSAYKIPYAIYRGGQSIQDAEWSPGEHYTIAGIIANSSNIGMSQVAESISPQLQDEYLHNFGLDEPTGLNLPGESQGLLPRLKDWPGDERYTLSYGQGIEVTAVQMASVYATIANGGVRVQPSLIAGTYNAAGDFTKARPSPSRRVIQAKTARQLIQILQQVPGVDDAAQQYWGEIPGYAIAAKTGTSSEPSSNPKKPCPKSIPLCIHGSSYIGMAPGNGPQVVVAVNVQDPKTSTDYFGDMVAGPVFYNVMKFALQTLQIQPQPGLVAPHVRLNAR